MQPFVFKIKTIVAQYLENDEFVVAQLNENDHEIRFLIVSTLNNINVLTNVMGKTFETTFLKQIESVIENLLFEQGLTKKVIIETEVLYGRKK